MSVQYLTTPIVDKKQTDYPRYGMAADGYTLRSGAPTSYMVKLQGEKIWRRVMCWQFSNAGTCFVRIKGVPHIVRSLDQTGPRPYLLENSYSLVTSYTIGVFLSMKFTLEIDLGNAAMLTGYDLAVALDKVAKRVNGSLGNAEIGPMDARVRGVMDSNGNTVGSWKIEE